MQIEIFDVGHGHCSVITTPNGRRLMVDCGTRFRDERLWWPSIHYYGHEIAMVSLLNLDEDHLSDFGPVLQCCRVNSLLSNPTIGPHEFTVLKKQGMGPGAKSYLDWLNRPRANVPAVAQDFGGVQWHAFWNHFGGPYETTNDLSLALFVWLGSFSVLFAGDLEAKGWRGMLANPDFCRLARSVRILVASHHGRDNGRCEELFDLMNPEIVIISDDSIQYGTQETSSWYRQRCKGAALIADPTQRRYVVTTRNDGSMRISVFEDGSWRLDPNIPVRDHPLSQPKQTNYDSLLTSPLRLNALNDPLGLGALNLFAQR